MRKQSAVQRLTFSMEDRRVLILAVFLLFAFHSLLSTAHAAEIRSKSAVAIEASTGRILYGKNPNLRLPPASTTKLMTAMVVLDRVTLSDTLVISERAATVSPVKAHFRAGEKVTVETLLSAALIKSANDAAYALAEGVGGSEERFVDLMNQKVIALGLSDTKFINATGLPGHGQYTTGYDLARMLRYALRYPLIKEIINTKASRISTEDGRAIFIKNSNRLLWADESMLGGKTGYTREAKHCFVCASEHANETVITALMGAPSRETLWKESEELMEKGFAIINGKEEPLMDFTRADYKASVQPAAYKVKTTEVKEGSHKKKAKKTVKKKKRSPSKTYVKKDKAKSGSSVEEKG
jgi:D-alanyl-D-alanine carboxypeptidase (penicillin-binding protein 5/6)